MRACEGKRLFSLSISFDRVPNCFTSAQQTHQGEFSLFTIKAHHLDCRILVLWEARGRWLSPKRLRLLSIPRRSQGILRGRPVLGPRGLKPLVSLQTQIQRQSCSYRKGWGAASSQTASSQRTRGRQPVLSLCGFHCWPALCGVGNSSLED